MSSLQKYALPPRDLQYYANGQNGCYSQAGEFPRFAARTDSYWLCFRYTSNYAKPQQHNSKVLMETPTFQTTCWFCRTGTRDQFTSNINPALCLYEGGNWVFLNWLSEREKM